MRSVLLYFAITFLVRVAFGGNDDLLRTRELYYKASSDKRGAEQFDTFLATSPNLGSSLLLGYKGMCCMIMANYTWNPYNKLSYFTKGRNLLDDAINRDVSNIELRFLRFCVQTHAPGFLGYSAKIDEDKAVIVKGFAQLKDNDLRDRIKNYLGTSKHCSPTDKVVLK